MRAVYILSGGRSSRFGSDKARAMVRMTPLISRIQHAISSQVSCPVFAVAEAVDAYQDLGITTIGDSVPHMGPVSGVVTALEHLRGLTAIELGQTPNATLRQSEASIALSSWCLIVSCDLLEWHHAWLARLSEELVKHEQNCEDASTPESSSRALPARAVCFRIEPEKAIGKAGSRWNPFPGLYHVDVLHAARLVSQSPKASMQSLLNHPSICTIAVSSENVPAVYSANTPKELANWKDSFPAKP